MIDTLFELIVPHINLATFNGVCWKACQYKDISMPPKKEKSVFFSWLLCMQYHVFANYVCHQTNMQASTGKTIMYRGVKTFTWNIYWACRGHIIAHSWWWGSVVHVHHERFFPFLDSNLMAVVLLRTYQNLKITFILIPQWLKK